MNVVLQKMIKFYLEELGAAVFLSHERRTTELNTVFSNTTGLIESISTMNFSLEITQISWTILVYPTLVYEWSHKKKPVLVVRLSASPSMVHLRWKAREVRPDDLERHWILESTVLNLAVRLSLKKKSSCPQFPWIEFDHCL